MKTDLTSVPDSGYFLLAMENITNLFLLRTSTTKTQQKEQNKNKPPKNNTMKTHRNQLQKGSILRLCNRFMFFFGAVHGVPYWHTWMQYVLGSHQSKSTLCVSRLSSTTMTGTGWVLWRETGLIPELWPMSTSNKTLTCSSTSGRPTWWWHTSSTSTTYGVLYVLCLSQNY